MGNNLDKPKYTKIFDPATFKLDDWIKYYQHIEENFPLGSKSAQIESCYKYVKTVKTINDMEKFMHEGAFLLGLIKDIKKEEYVKYDNVKLSYYDKMYQEIYTIMTTLA